MCVLVEDALPRYIYLNQLNNLKEEELAKSPEKLQQK